MMIRSLTVAAAGLALSTAASGAVISLGEFNTDGNVESFTKANIPTLDASGGFLTGTVSAGSDDPQLFRNFTAGGGTAITPAAGETFSTVEFRVRETGPTAGNLTTFDPAGLIFIANGTILANGTPNPLSFSATASTDDFFIVTADISALGSTSITNIRLDPVGGPGARSNTFNVDYIRVNTVPEPASLALLGLGGLALMGRRRG